MFCRYFLFVIWPAFNNGQTLEKDWCALNCAYRWSSCRILAALLREGLLYGLAFQLGRVEQFFIAYFAKFQRTQINLAALGILCGFGLFCS